MFFYARTNISVQHRLIILCRILGGKHVYVCLTECTACVCFVSGCREPICVLASKAVGSTDEGREHGVGGIISAGLWSSQCPGV